jgi:hypothetical protein
MARTLDDWSEAVKANSGLPPWVLRVLAVYAEKPCDKRLRLMQRPRTEVAEALNISPRRVTKAIKRAKDAGWIVVARPARHGDWAMYQATFPGAENYGDPGTPLDDQNVRLGEGSPRSGSDFRGVAYYYGNDIVRPEVARRMELMGSVFTVLEERESAATISLSSGREMVEGWDCTTCGQPVENEGVSIGFAVCNRCAVVVDVEPDAPASERTAG